MVPLVGRPTMIGPTASNQVVGWLVSSPLTRDSLRAGASLHPALLPRSLLPQLLSPHLRHLPPLPAFPPPTRGQPGITIYLAHPSSRLGMIPPPRTFWPVLLPLGTPAYSIQAPCTTSFMIGHTCTPTPLMTAYEFGRPIMGTSSPLAVVNASVS